MRIGASYLNSGDCEFSVWAPFRSEVTLKIVSPTERLVPLEKSPIGYWKALVGDVVPGMLYFFLLDGETQRPDPASHFQPESVHGPSQVVDHEAFLWDDACWKGLDLEEMIVYELHVGTFTPDGSFDALIPRLDELQDLGVNTIEIMPVAQFPGERNWGYDGVYPFAVQSSYGGPEGLKRLINVCHQKGMAVLLDVVYNHLGPEGNYLRDFGPYFTAAYQTPWGEAVNFDGPYSDHVRNFFIENALYWLDLFHVDGLRLDAVHAIFDQSARPFLMELREKVEAYSRRSGRRLFCIAESDLNDTRIIRPRELGGFGMDAQWSDDFHHALHTLVTGEAQGYYADFGKVEHLAKALSQGYVYSGQHSQHRKRRHGSSPADRPARQFVVAAQNHDQVGNRMLGERLSNLVSWEALKLTAGVLLLSPYVPLLFMGEEYGEEAPFLYFVSHTDEDLVEAVRAGRKEEFKTFQWQGEPPDPQSPDTFRRSRLNWPLRAQGRHALLLTFHRKLIQFRKAVPALSSLDKERLQVLGFEEEQVLLMRRWQEDSHVFVLFNFAGEARSVRVSLPEGNWTRMLSSSETAWEGPGSKAPETIASGTVLETPGFSFVVYLRNERRPEGEKVRK